MLCSLPHSHQSLWKGSGQHCQCSPPASQDSGEPRVGGPLRPLLPLTLGRSLVTVVFRGAGNPTISSLFVNEPGSNDFCFGLAFHFFLLFLHYGLQL